MIRFKVCGMRDPENIREIVELNIDYLGFIFYRKSKRFIGENPDEGIFRDIPKNIQKAGVFVDEELNKVKRLSERYELQVLQLHGNESPGYCNDVKTTGLTVVKAFGIEEGFRFERLAAYMSVCDFFLFDTKTSLYGGSGKKYGWHILEKYKLDKPFFLSGGIGKEDTDKLIGFKHDQLYAIDINSKFEKKPAVKDVQMVKSFIEEIQKSGI